jgi:hypothetical protein
MIPAITNHPSTMGAHHMSPQFLLLLH